VIEAEAIQPADGDVLDALQASAAREQTTPEKLRERLEKAGRLDDVRDELAQRAAVDLLAEHAMAVPLPASDAEGGSGGSASDKLWTPDKEAPPSGEGSGSQLWTPGS
jgi:trigger factor